MSARSVCSGTRPSRYHSLRLISAPPRRPPHCTRMPWAPGLHRGLDRALHRAPEAHAPGELVPDALGDQRRVELGLLDLLDVEVDLRVAGDLQQTRAQAVRLRAAPADDDARARGVDVDAQTVARALDLDAAHHRSFQLLLQVVTDLPVLDELVRVLLVLGEPPRLPVGGDPEAEPVRVDLLTHYLLASGSEPSSPSGLGRVRVRLGLRRLDFFVLSRLRGLVDLRRSASASLGGVGLADHVVVVVVVVIVVVIVRLGRRGARRDPAATREPAPAVRRRTRSRGRLARGARHQVFLGVAGHDDGDVAGALADPRAPTAGTGPVALGRRALVGPGAGDEQLVGREVVVVLRVRDRGVQELRDLFGRAPLAEPQHLARVVDVQATDEAEHLPDLGGRRARVLEGRACLGHGYRRPWRSWPAWKRNVRVGANSPSL